MSKKLLTLIGAFLLLSIIVSACGSTPTPKASTDVTAAPTHVSQVTPAGLPTENTTIKVNDPQFCGSVKYDQEITCTDGIATISLDENNNVLAKIIADPNPYTAETGSKLTLDVQRTDKLGNYYEHLVCTYDGNAYKNPTYASSIGSIERTETHKIECTYGGKTVMSGWLYYFYGSSLAQELTAMAPTSASMISTGTATSSQTSNATLPANVTPTATREGDHCPAVIDNIYSVKFEYVQAQNLVIMKATVCRLYTTGGVKLYGFYLGEQNDGREWWQWNLPVNPKDGSVQGIQMGKKSVTDYGKCQYVNYMNGFLYIQCPFVKPTSTATFTATATGTSTATPTKIATPTYGPTTTVTP